MPNIRRISLNPDFIQITNKLDREKKSMVQLLRKWSGMNTFSYNRDGLQIFLNELEREFAKFSLPMKEIALKDEVYLDTHGKKQRRKLGKGLAIGKNSGAPLSIFLGIHYDTVYSPEGPVPRIMQKGNDILQGPGVADAKGGIVMLLKILEQFEATELAKNLDWEIFLNPDEEIGSPGSREYLAACAARHNLGLLFEPCLPDGTLIGQRGGSGFFEIIVRGKAAHVGRDFSKGRNALHAMARIIVQLEKYALRQKFIFNVGKVDGGGPANVVTDLAICRFNIRIHEHQNPVLVLKELKLLITEMDVASGIKIILQGDFHNQPKPLTDQNLQMLQQLALCGRDLGQSIKWQRSNGVCDGNRLQAAGLPVIDTMGPRGDKIHSPQEFVYMESLVERAKLTLLFLLQMASGNFPWPAKTKR
jgi:glutamate carboxypeptidase